MPGLSQPRVVAISDREGVVREQQCRRRRAAGVGLGMPFCVALGAEDLADLEQVVALATVERDDRGGVVDVELVVAVVAVHRDAGR